jgi:hypothetical protein
MYTFGEIRKAYNYSRKSEGRYRKGELDVDNRTALKQVTKKWGVKMRI